MLLVALAIIVLIGAYIVLELSGYGPLFNPSVRARRVALSDAESHEMLVHDLRALPSDWPVRQPLIDLAGEMPVLRDILETASTHGVSAALDEGPDSPTECLTIVEGMLWNGLDRYTTAAAHGPATAGMQRILEVEAIDLRRVLDAMRSAEAGLREQMLVTTQASGGGRARSRRVTASFRSVATTAQEMLRMYGEAPL